MPRDNEYNDYFDSDSTEEEESQPSTEHQQYTDTPESRDEQEIESQTIGKRGGKLRKAVAVFLSVVVVVVAVWAYVVYCVPYVSEAQQRGTIVELRREGYIFDTYEGQMVSEERLVDTVHIYERDFIFSVVDDSLAHDIMQLKMTGKRVTLTYKEYRGALPWRGNSTIIVTDCKVQ